MIKLSGGEVSARALREIVREEADLHSDLHDERGAEVDVLAGPVSRGPTEDF